MLSCSMCNNPDEYCFTGMCSKCNELKKIIDLYGIDRVNKSLTEIFVREERPINHRTEAIAGRPRPETRASKKATCSPEQKKN